MGCRVTLGDICSFDRGASIPRTRMLNSGDLLYIHYGDLYKGFDLRIDVEKPAKPLPFISADEKIKDSQRLNDQDIVYVLTSETVDDLGHAYLFNNPSGKSAVSGTETTIVRVERKDVVLPAYLNYLMSSPRFISELRQYTRGMKVFRVHPSDVARIEVDLPSIDEQRKVVAILDAIYEKQQTNTKLNDYLAELLDVLFVDMLNDADASWERLSLLDIASYKNGLAMQKFRPAPGDPGLPVLKIKELGQGVCTPDSERCASTIDESVKIHDGNLVFSWSGTLLLDFWAGGDAGLNQHLFKVTSDRYPSWLYYLWTKHHMDRFIMLAKDRATTMGHIKRSALAESEVLIPPVEQLEVLTRRMQPIVDELVVNKIQSRNLAGLRDVLLPKLMSGEIDVSNVRLSMPPNNHLSAG
ncbi:restriction endonuclease subunit S [Ellagibacter isourolithinifaciens]|uniref:restriction endonuclease subunit S n=1 Tax=Ellagibacter isourolithinifaciens TaxID=2137581 RepID=UPI003A9383B9